MARRNRKGQFVKGGRSSARRTTRSSSTHITVSAPRSVSKPKAKRRRSHSGGGGGGGLLSGIGKRVGTRGGIMLGSALLGYASKEHWLEKIPLVGRAGPITSFGLLGFGAEEFMKMKLHPILHDAVTCALAISAFNFGLSGGQLVVGQDMYAMPGGAVFFD